MKKKLLYVIAFLIVTAQVPAFVLAKSTQISPAVKVAIKKYKRGNYTGCLQDCQNIIAKDKHNPYAYYYMAMSYVQAGKKDPAIAAYTKVLSLKTNAKLAEYATTGKRCLETPDQCHLQQVNATTESASELDKFIASPNSDILSPEARKEVEKRRLEGIKNQINTGKELDTYYFHKTQTINGEKIAMAEDASHVEKKTSPSNEDIAAAMKVLEEAGMNPYSGTKAVGTTPDLSQMMMGLGGQGSNNNMMEMLPYMMTQNKDGTSNYSPQVMQSIILNSMMTNFAFDTDKDKQ